MLKVSQMEKMPVLKPKKPKERKKKSKAKGKEQHEEGLLDVSKLDPGELQRIGKIHLTVCSPDGHRVVGFLIRRPDIAGMVKQKDVFIALDSFDVSDYGLVATRGDDSFDDAARERLHLDWEKCIIWAGMDAKTTNGRELGWVNDLSFDPHSGTIDKFFVGDGGVAGSLVGYVEIPVSMLRGYQKGFMLVDPEASKLQLDGGFAAKAGESYARAKVEGKAAGKKAATAADRVVQKGAYGLGKLIGKAKHSIEEYQKEDEPELTKSEPREVKSVSEPVEEPKLAAAEPVDVEDVPAAEGQPTEANEPRVRTFVAASEAEEACDSKPAAAEKPQPAAAQKSQPTAAQKPATAAKPKPATTAKPAAKKSTSKKRSAKKRSAGDEAAVAFGRGLGKMNSMFGSFVDEYKKSSK